MTKKNNETVTTLYNMFRNVNCASLFSNWDLVMAEVLWAHFRVIPQAASHIHSLTLYLSESPCSWMPLRSVSTDLSLLPRWFLSRIGIRRAETNAINVHTQRSLAFGGVSFSLAGWGENKQRLAILGLCLDKSSDGPLMMKIGQENVFKALENFPICAA